MLFVFACSAVPFPSPSHLLTRSNGIIPRGGGGVAICIIHARSVGRRSDGHEGSEEEASPPSFFSPFPPCQCHASVPSPTFRGQRQRHNNQGPSLSLFSCPFFSTVGLLRFSKGRKEWKEALLPFSCTKEVGRSYYYSCR